MAKKFNRVRMTVSGTPGTGTINLGSAVGGYQSFASAGASASDLVNYLAEDGGAWEVGTATWNSTPSLSSRTLIVSSTGALLNLSSSAIISSDAFAEDLNPATASQVRTGTNDQAPTSSKSLSDAAAIETLTDGANIAWNMNTSFNAKVTLGGNRTFDTPTNAKPGWVYVLQVIQDGTGNRTMTWPALTIFDWGEAGLPTLSTGASKIDLVSLYCITGNVGGGTPLFRAVFNKAAA